MSDKHPHVVNLDEIAWYEGSHGDAFDIKGKQLGVPAGSQKLGCTYYEQAPGKRAFPYHFHEANEEAVFILEGEGTLRIGDQRVALRAGDYVALPVGAATAHQMLNESTSILRYLCMSTAQLPEIVQYPDSGKVGVRAGVAPHVLRTMFRTSSGGLDYWDGEDGSEGKGGNGGKSG